MLSCSISKTCVRLRRRWRRRWWRLLLQLLLGHGESGAAAERDGGRHCARERERLLLLQICCCCWCCCSCACRHLGSLLANGSLLVSESLQLSFMPRCHRGLLLLERVHAMLKCRGLRADRRQDALLELARGAGCGSLLANALILVTGCSEPSESRIAVTHTGVFRVDLELIELQVVRVLGTCSSRRRGSRSETCGASCCARRRTTKTEVQRSCMRCPEHLCSTE